VVNGISGENCLIMIMAKIIPRSGMSMKLEMMMERKLLQTY